MRKLALTLMLIASCLRAWAQVPPLTIQWLSRPIVNQDSRFPSVTADGNRVVFQVDTDKGTQIWEAVWNPATNRWHASFVPIPQKSQHAPIIGVHPVASADGNHITFISPLDYGFGTNGKAQVYAIDRSPDRNIAPDRLALISVLRQDTNGDGIGDTWQLSFGNCVPVFISSDGRIVVFLFVIDDDNDGIADEDPINGKDDDGDGRIDEDPLMPLNIVDADGDGQTDRTPLTLPAPSSVLLIHDRDADGNGIYDEAGIGATRTFVGSVLGIDNDGDKLVDEDPVDDVDNDNDGRIDEDGIEPRSVVSPIVSTNGRFVAFMTPDNDGDGRVDEDPINGADDDGDGRIDEDPPASWQVIVQDIQTGQVLQVVDNAFMPTLSDDASYVAVLCLNPLDNDKDAQVNEDPIDGRDNDGDGRIDEDFFDPIDNDGDGRIDEDPRNFIDDDGDGGIDEDQPDLYFHPTIGMTVDLIVRRVADGRELRLSGLSLPPQTGTTDGTSGFGYSDWWGAATIAVDPTILEPLSRLPIVVYVAFHSWATNLVDLKNAALSVKPEFYQGVANIFVVRFDFTPDATIPILLFPFDIANPTSSLPVSLELVSPSPLTYRLPLASSLMPTVSFVQQVGTLKFLSIVFQSLVPFGDQTVVPSVQDTDGRWDIYLVTVPLP